MATFSLEASTDRRFTLSWENRLTGLRLEAALKVKDVEGNGLAGCDIRTIGAFSDDTRPDAIRVAENNERRFTVEEHAGDDGVATFDSSLDS